MAEASVIITLPGERPQSWNKAYAGQHWAKRKAEVERVRMAIRAEIDPETCTPFADPVDVVITVFFADRPLDADNVPAKLYIDGFKGWLLVDDDRRFVRSVRTVVEVDRSRPRVEIEIRPVEIHHTPAGVFELLANPPYGLTPAPDGSRVLVADVQEEFGQGATRIAEPAAGSGAFLRLDF